MNCECKEWCDADPKIRMLTGHHAHCQRGGDPLQAAVKLIADLVHGMESCGRDCDGIHPDEWEAYKRGKAVIGEFDWKEEGHA